MILALLRRLMRRDRGPQAELRSYFPHKRAAELLECDRRDEGQYRDAERRVDELKAFRHRIASG